MKSRTNLNDVSAVCRECAEAAGCKPKPKTVGVWIDTCEICKECKPCTDLWHDWIVPKQKGGRRGKSETAAGISVTKKREALILAALRLSEKGVSHLFDCVFAEVKGGAE